MPFGMVMQKFVNYNTDTKSENQWPADRTRNIKLKKSKNKEEKRQPSNVLRKMRK